MKRLLFALCLVLPMVLVSCDDDDLPNVNFDVEFSNAVNDGNTLYVVQGQTLTIDGIKVFNNEEGKGAMITSATYFWDGFGLGTNFNSPYGYTIPIGNDISVGNHLLTITCPLFAEDKSAASILMDFDVVVVASPDDLPEVPQTPETTHLQGTANVTK